MIDLKSDPRDINNNKYTCLLLNLHPDDVNIPSKQLTANKIMLKLHTHDRVYPVHMRHFLDSCGSGSGLSQKCLLGRESDLHLGKCKKNGPRQFLQLKNEGSKYR